MDIQSLTNRALETKNQYDALAAQNGTQPWTNAHLMEGFVGDVGDLMKLVMAKEGVRTIENVDEKLAHELADCLWSILVLSHGYGVNIEEAFTQTMNSLEQNISRHA